MCHQKNNANHGEIRNLPLFGRERLRLLRLQLRVLCTAAGLIGLQCGQVILVLRGCCEQLACNRNRLGWREAQGSLEGRLADVLLGWNVAA